QVDCAGATAERDFVCPLAFWGLSRIIERHSEERRLSRPELADLVDVKPHAFRVEPVEGRDSLPVLRGALVAGSQRVEKSVPGGLREICCSISDGNADLHPVQDWEAWTTQVQGDGPSLLVLIVHTDLSD